MADNDSQILMLIDDEPAQSRLISALAAREGWRTIIVGDADTALATLNSREGVNIAAILVDQWVPGEDSSDLIGVLKQMRPDLPILMLTASASPLIAVQAMRAGATDYLIKPIAPDRFLQALRSATTREAPRNELQPLSEKMSATLDFEDMIGTAPAFRSALAQAAKAARGQGHALVEGESGTGKETILRAMHSASPRAKNALKVINVGGVPINSIESLLFGHEQNAFPGAFERQIGALQQCDGGTIILDEIDRLALPVQDRLADTLATGIVRPTGAKHGFRVEVRMLCASNFRLSEIAQGGQFSSALLSQIGNTRIHLPPLRERTSDIPALTRHFLARIGEQPGLNHHSITDSALNLLASYDWPGNVRQLQAALFRAAVFCDDEALTANSFPQLSEILGECEDQSDRRQDGAGILLYTADGNLRPLEDIEADVIRLAIGHYSGRMTEVARRLGIGRSTLYRKLSNLGIDSAA
ncbi:response regulator [Altererythrobacter aurantiacus]|uniref:DNA-binding transcriptional regulator NtrC n=1 Tax=Parapontixanthobacter aurantiacus TaxID=1463599 RepID=A0A844ZAI0_9SPHN|nr:sigma-54 dependent transcriptional regulator [Parapontixanthobacter aurantiacus]MXO84798.1 response regulator [Parapontixanthobacter aurantiacus]